MIKFGKDGWTAKISEEFTFGNVRAAAREIAGSLKPNDSLVIGYDSRFLAEKFATEIVKVMTTAKIGCYLPERDMPLPVAVWEVGDRGAAGGVMVTGGGLAADFCGVSFIKGQVTVGKEPGIERFDPRERYFRYAEASVDAEAIKRAGLKIVVDPMFGSVRGYFDVLLQRLGCRVDEINNYRDVLFGGLAPDPKEENLAGLKAAMDGQKADLGLAFNGDGSAFAVIDGQGQYKYHGEAGDALLNCLRLVELSAKKKI
jgi:phosphomannomutase